LLPCPVLYGRWLWRGGSTRSHPELGSENPLRGWYCRGHPVGEYGAAGLFYSSPPASIPISSAGAAAFLYANEPELAAGWKRRGGACWWRVKIAQIWRMKMAHFAP